MEAWFWQSQMIACPGRLILPTTNREHLNLSRSSVGDKVRVAVEAVNNNSNIDMVGLMYCGIDDDDAAVIADMLKSNRSLQRLDLGQNVLGDKGAAHLAEALKTNRTLTWLDLGGCSIGDRGVDSLGRALKYNGTLRYLGLDYIDANRFDSLMDVLPYTRAWVAGLIEEDDERNLGRFEMETLMGAENQNTPAGQFVRACGDRGVLRLVLSFLL